MQECLAQDRVCWDIMGPMGGIHAIISLMWLMDGPTLAVLHSGLRLGCRVWAHEDLWEMIMMAMRGNDPGF